MDQPNRTSGRWALALLLLSACTAPNPDYNKVSINGGSSGQAMGGMLTPLGTGGDLTLPVGTGGFPYETGGAGGDGSGAPGGISGGGGVTGSDALASDTLPGAGGARMDTATGIDGAMPSPDARPDTMTNPPPDTSTPVPDGNTSPPDAAAPMDTSVGPPDAAAGTPDTNTMPDVISSPDLGSNTNGLRGDYFNGQNFETFAFTRIDQQVNFNWIKDGPDPRVGADNFSVRWTGYIEPRYTGSYTISTITDDGVRLWVDNVNYVDSWTTQSGIEHTAVVNLIANRRYAIRMEFFDKAYTASAQLFWKSAQQAKEIIPFTRLWTP